MTAVLVVLAVLLAFLAGGLAATWAWAFLVLLQAKHRADQ